MRPADENLLKTFSTMYYANTPTVSVWPGTCYYYPIGTSSEHSYIAYDCGSSQFIPGSYLFYLSSDKKGIASQQEFHDFRNGHRG